MTAPKIIHTVELCGDKGSIPFYVGNLLLPALSAAGYNVSVVCRNNKKRETTTSSGIRVTMANDESEVCRYIRNEKPDIVHVHDWPATDILRELQNLSTTRVIIQHHGYGFICQGRDLYWRRQGCLCQEGFGVRCIWNAYLKCCQSSRRPTEVVRGFMRIRQNLTYAKYVDRFIAVSNYIKSKLVKAGLSEKRIVVLNNCTEVQHVPTILPMPGRILYIGRIAEAKGLNLLISAVTELDKKLNWSLMVAGDGYYEPRIRRMVEEKGISDKVMFTGWVDGEQKLRLLHEAAVVVVPSLWPEAFGIVGIEAMACGRPVVGFDVGGIRDWLENDVTGYLVPAQDSKELTLRIETLLSKPELANKIGQMGLVRVEERFRPESHVDRLLSIYEDILTQ